MANKIILKKSSVAAKVPTTSDLDYGELALNYADGKAYYKKSTNVIDNFLSVSALANSTVTVNGIQLANGGANEALLTWNSTKKTAELTMGNGVVQQIGEEVYYPLVTYNNTGVTIPNGTPVMISGGPDNIVYIVPAIADGSIPDKNYLGLTTEDIPNQSYGRVTFFGIINDIDTSAFSRNDKLYVSPTNPGTLVNYPPASPNHVIFVGIVTASNATTGSIFVRYQNIPDAIEINYSNTSSGLVASNVQSAIDELQDTKASIDMLSSNITVFPTTVVGDFGYLKMVTSVADPDYNTTAADVSTGVITTDNQLVGSLIAKAGLFVGALPYINVPTIGNVAKVGGNSQQYASFYFVVYRRDAGGVETLVATSNDTGSINPTDTAYRQFNATAIIDNTWATTDRLVIKYYAHLTGNAGATYNFQFGGSSPVRTELPVPVSVIPSGSSATLTVDTTAFNKLLTSADNTVQHALNTLDDHVHPTSESISAVEGASALTLSGTISHTGLVPTEGTNIDQVKTITKAITLTTDWQDTGISGTDIATGTYVMQLFANDLGAGGTNNNEYYSGTLSWYSGVTNSSYELPTDEIVLHRAGGSGDGALYLRTYRTPAGNLKMQIYSNQPNSSSSNYVFKFRRMI